MKVRLRDKSGVRLYRYVVEDVDRHGNVRIYFKRKKGQPKIRLTEIPGTDAFDAEYQRAFRGEIKPPNQHTAVRPETLRWLCEKHYASAQFQSLAPGTRKDRPQEPRKDLSARRRFPLPADGVAACGEATR
jgi:hypothetical protein